MLFDVQKEVYHLTCCKKQLNNSKKMEHYRQITNHILYKAI